MNKRRDGQTIGQTEGDVFFNGGIHDPSNLSSVRHGPVDEKFALMNLQTRFKWTHQTKEKGRSYALSPRPFHVS